MRLPGTTHVVLSGPELALQMPLSRTAAPFCKAGLFQEHWFNWKPLADPYPTLWATLFFHQTWILKVEIVLAIIERHL